MITEFIITFREALEICLVVGIILAYLARTKATEYNKDVYTGVVAGIAGSVVVGAAFINFKSNLEAIGLSEQMFEGLVMLLAVGMITWLVLWIMQQKHYREHIEKRVKRHVDSGYATGLVLFTFVSVLREGFETVVFLGATAFNAGALSVGAALAGIIAAIMLSVLLFTAAMRINLKLFFNATTIFLVIFAAGLAAHAVHEFQEVNVLPQGQELWNTKSVLDDKSPAGTIARALFGYNDNPTLLEVAAWAAYLAFIGVLYNRQEAGLHAKARKPSRR